MGSVIHFLRQEPPATLYHYTTGGGLLGIIRGKEIWASHTQYLNDRMEFRHGIEIVLDEVGRLKKERKNHSDLLDEMQQVADPNAASINVCVCSFSEDGDLLSQWRAYGGGCGFSLGFAGRFLRSVCERERFWLVPCVYDEAQQRELIRALLIDVLDENVQRQAQQRQGAKLQGAENPSRIRGGNLRAYLNRYAPILKHRSFAEEREWRVISRPLASPVERFEYRAGPSMLIPYYRIPLAAENAPFHMNEVIVGPTPHPLESSESLRSLLAKHDLDGVSVRNTAAPYRNW